VVAVVLAQTNEELENRPVATYRMGNGRRLYMIKSADSGVFNTDAMVVERERLKQIFTFVLSAHIVSFYDIDTHARLQRLLVRCVLFVRSFSSAIHNFVYMPMVT